MLDSDGASLEMDRYTFQPSVERARRVEARVRAGLADSLAAALNALAGQGGPREEKLLARVRAGPVAPVVFGAYTELVEAILAEDIQTAIEIANELCASNLSGIGDLRIVTLTDAFLGKGQAGRYRRLVDENTALGAELQALTPAAFASARDMVKEAIALLDAAAPDVADEFGTLVHEIVLVDRVGSRPFSASSFQLWGTLFLKLNPKTTRVEIAESLAHETGHALLFGLSMGKPLVENPPQERYPSPIRHDPRPMDGVVHATYVIARMHYTMARLLESGLLTNDEERIALRAKERHRGYYAQGLPVITDHARWTPEGEAAFASAKAYMCTAQ